MAGPLRIVFMGTPDFAVPSLRALAARPDLVNILRVYTQPDRPAGRGQKVTEPPIKIVALELGLTVLQPENVNDADEKRKLADLMADVVIVVAYAQFLSRAILNTPRLGCINVHSSLLPKYRGAAPIQYAIWKGERESGVSTMKLVPKMDAGPVLLQKSTPITDEMTAAELHDALANMGGALIVETLEQLREGKQTEKEQDESLVTFAPLIKKEHGLIYWDKPGHEILAQIRAFDPWPGTFGRSTRGTLKILKARFHSNVEGAPAGGAAGDIFTLAGGLWVKCGDGWIELLRVQPEGRRAMEIQEFLNGLHNASFGFEKSDGLKVEEKHVAKTENWVEGKK
ncbi:MAG: methionyl-tRNA formyltransferase [Deltaproteobacteria bacterium]|nr:methionyl-tRNA formyltransferase [Deltaproteobacteria bacterium]